MRAVLRSERVWLALCACSLVVYLLRSETVRAFGREMSRLIEKFC